MIRDVNIVHMKQHFHICGDYRVFVHIFHFPGLFFSSHNVPHCSVQKLLFDLSLGILVCFTVDKVSEKAVVSRSLNFFVCVFMSASSSLLSYEYACLCVCVRTELVCHLHTFFARVCFPFTCVYVFHSHTHIS